MSLTDTQEEAARLTFLVFHVEPPSGGFFLGQ